MADSIGLMGGTVVDPEVGLHGPGEVLIDDGIVVDVGEGVASRAETTIDCRGAFVLPGLIDSHTHTFARTSNIGAPLREGCLERGVLAAIDAGSAGAATFSAYAHLIANEAPIPAWSLLNVSSIGIVDLKVGELRDEGYFDLERAAETIERFGPLIKGLKVRLSRHVMNGPCIDRLRASVEFAESVHRPVMVHLGDSVEPLWDLLPVLRAGDIVSHMYTGNESGILENGMVHPAVFEARDRGVLYDSAHGSSNFSFPVARAAVAAGLWPDTVSSDLSLRNWRGPVFDLPTTMSKLLMLGMNFDALVAATTSTPARIFGLAEDGFGTIRLGSTARISILRLGDSPRPVEDSFGNQAEAAIFEPLYAIQGSEVVRSVPRSEHRGWPRPF